MSNQPEWIVVGYTDSLTAFHLSRGHTAGLTMAVAASLLSLGSVLYAFFFIINANWYSSTGFRIFRHTMDILVFALLFADLVQAIGGLLSLKWIVDGIVRTGVVCTAQGILKTLGETGVALTTLLIAIYTFVGVSTGKCLESMGITVALVVGIWIFVGILIGAGHAASRGPYMTPVPYWCWVSFGSHNTWRVVGEYLWMWTSLVVSCLLYIPLYLWMRGNLVFHDSKWFAWSFQWTFSDAGNVRSVRRKALVMLLYPIVYCVCIIPLTVVRWMSFGVEAKHGAASVPPPGRTLAVITVFGLSGFLNVILVFTTKPNLGLFGQREETTSRRNQQLRADSESGVMEMKRLPSQTRTNPANPT